ncbi:caspase recruitment domain-containing protein 19 isoform X1 [Onychomys torridus]|uniref:caspase recruitment domain-containing protein 19 isoform X1 n=1 Tax=Onychomys torridus TaxID=38674 RepID=UPI00167F2B94|nr:caspase recruitment domain-containing protein 19 isoform X1 [Onychomys torridus]
MTDQTYCDRLVQDTPFLTGQGRLSEQQVDRIILQLNRYYPQILTNKEAEKFRNPKASLRVRLCDLLSHLQQRGERHCQEFYRALYIHAQPLHNHLPSRHALQNSAFRELDWDSESRELSDRGNAPPPPFSFPLPSGLCLCPRGFSIPHWVFFLAFCWGAGPLECSPTATGHPTPFSPGPMSFLAGLGLAAGLALLLYCCPPDPKVLPGTRRILAFSPVIIDSHVSRYLLAFLADDLGGF